MLKRTAAVAALCVSVAWLSGCMTVATPAIGTIIADVTWDGEANGALGSKEGKACAKSIFGFVASGDASIKAAAKAGGISNVTRVDHHTKNILGFGDYCTIVGGN